MAEPDTDSDSEEYKDILFGSDERISEKRFLKRYAYNRKCTRCDIAGRVAGVVLLIFIIALLVVNMALLFVVKSNTNP